MTTESDTLITQIQPVKAQNIDVLPSSYIQIEDFLTAEEHQLLLNYVLDRELQFVVTTTSTNEMNYRQSKVLYSFPEFSELITTRIKSLVPDVVNRLGLPSFPITYIESQLTAHNDGNYFKIHNDNGSPETSLREITYVYYFHQEPKQFSGGELLIYDSKIINNFYVNSESFTTIEPRNNSIVFFLSRYLHEVLPVNCHSQVFADSRFTINGWVNRAANSV
ncbi:MULTISPECIES: 2OG-Fe(II) oxygenase [unclassified Tolypothrix]|uniref:2OG-Fe(II) oxygenase n=1 Tax=unclassified Tolypothrix TaxID=2649714 RepID=UPI001D136676|nr:MULTISPECIES: 2OG-Fe(II) oxygenase [unclassified Tolypothrix]